MFLYIYIYSGILQQSWVNHLGDLQHRCVQWVLDHDGPKAFVEAERTLFTPYCVYAVPHSLILRVNGKHLEAQVCVINDSASSLNMQPVQHRLQRKQQYVGTQVGHEASDQLWKISVQHGLDRLHTEFSVLGWCADVAAATQNVQH